MATSWQPCLRIPQTSTNGATEQALYSLQCNRCLLIDSLSDFFAAIVLYSLHGISSLALEGTATARGHANRLLLEGTRLLPWKDTLALAQSMATMRQKQVAK